MRPFLSAAFVSIATLGVTSPAIAGPSLCASVTGNLVTNCGFETANLNGWTTTGNLTNPPGGFNGSPYGIDAADGNSGNDGLYIGPIGAVANLSQNLTLAANTQYTVTFYLKQNTIPFINSNHTFNAEIDNLSGGTLVSLLSLNNYATAGPYTQYAYTFTLTNAQLGGSTGTGVLAFTFRNDDDYWSLDDVSVASSGVTITKAFNPTTIQSGGTSVVTLTLSSSNTVAFTGGSFTDTLANMSATGGAVTGTCTGTTPASLSAGATAVSFTGINIPATSSCTITFSVASNTAGVQPNTTSGVTTTQTPTPGGPSNTANLTVLAPPGISKAFNPSTIQFVAPSVVTLTLSNSNASTLTAGAFTDTLANMSAVGGSVTGTCGASPASLTAGQTSLSFSGISISANSSCTVIFSVTSNTAGAQPNQTSGATTTQTPIAGSPSNIATLTVLAPPTITKGFNPPTIAPGGTSIVTLTLSNSNLTTAFTGGAFTDTLSNMTAAGGPVTGTCGASPASLTAGATALSFSGISISANSSCSVIFNVTSNAAGVQPNTTSGVTTTQTTTAGPVSNSPTLTVLAPPTISKAFNPTSIPTGGTSTVTLTLTNSNPGIAFTGASFSDTLSNMTASGGTVTGTCTGISPGTLSSGQTSLSFSGISIPAAGNCTVIFSVTSNSPGVQPNTASGVITTQTTPNAGPVSNTANLTVLNLPTVAKSFNPTTIQPGGTSLVTVTLSNSNGIDLNGAAFTDTLANMTAAGGAVAGTCVGTSPNTLTAGSTLLSFIGILRIPAGGSCTVTFSVTSTVLGAQPNTATGVTTTQTPSPGPSSPAATLNVIALPTIAKAFSPTTIQSGATSAVTLTLSNTNAITLTGGAFTDTLANMSAAGGSVTGTCGASPGSLPAGQTALSFTNISIPANGTCTIIFSVTSSNVATNPNTTSGVTTTQTPTAGAVSNTANLTVTSLTTPTITKAFAPSTIQSGGTSTVTLTLSNSTASPLTGGAVSDTLINMSAPGGAVTGSCGASPSSLSANQTALSFTGMTIPASGSCTVIFSVTSTNVGANNNTTTGVTTTQTPTAGSVSNTATLTVLAAPAINKAFNPTSITSGGTSVVTLTLSNSNVSTPLTGGAVSDTLTNMSAAGGAVTGTCGASPPSLSAGQTALNFTNISIPANGSCTVIFTVTSSNVASNPNTTTGVTTTQTPIAGSVSNTALLTVSNIAAITNVTSSVANGSYKVADVIPVLITFSKVVNVTGAPQLSLNSGGTVNYTSGSGTSTLTFTYTVALGQNSSHLDYTSTSALTLNGGSILDSGSVAANLALPTPGSAGSLSANKNIVIDTVAPTVVSYSVLFGSLSLNMSASTRNRLPWQITGIQVVFSEPVIATTAGLAGLSATGVSGSGTNIVTWTLSPVSNLPSTLTSVLGTTANAITDVADNPLGGGVNYNQNLKVLYGDFNDDGNVNAQDLVLINAARNQPYNIFADLNGDSVVDINDVRVVQQQVGGSNP